MDCYSFPRGISSPGARNLGLSIRLIGVGSSPGVYIVTYLAILGGLLFLGILTSKNYSAYSQKTDPSEVVIDEWLGMWIALYAVPKEMTWMIVSFLLFRFFDVVKVPPARQLERMHGGWGIMMDDVAAGLYALGLTHLLIWVMQ